MNDMTYEEVRNNFIQDLAENAYCGQALDWSAIE